MRRSPENVLASTTAPPPPTVPRRVRPGPGPIRLALAGQAVDAHVAAERRRVELEAARRHQHDVARVRVEDVAAALGQRAGVGHVAAHRRRLRRRRTRTRRRARRRSPSRTSPTSPSACVMVTSPLTLLNDTAPSDERPVARTSPDTLRSAATWARPVADDVAAHRLGARAAADLADVDVARDRCARRPTHRSARRRCSRPRRGCCFSCVVSTSTRLPLCRMSTLTLSNCARASASVLPLPCTTASILISVPLPPVTLTSPATLASFRLPLAPTLNVLHLRRRVDDLAVVLASLMCRPARSLRAPAATGAASRMPPAPRLRISYASLVSVSCPARAGRCRWSASRGRGRSAHDRLRSRPAPSTPVRFASLAIAIRSCSSATFWR